MEHDAAAASESEAKRTVDRAEQALVLHAVDDVQHLRANVPRVRACVRTRAGGRVSGDVGTCL